MVCSDRWIRHQGVPVRVSRPATVDIPEFIARAIRPWLAGRTTRARGGGWPPARPRAVLVLQWMVAGTALTTPARDTRVSRATAYWYLHEALGGVIASRAPDPPGVLRRLRQSGEPSAGPGGTLIRTQGSAKSTAGYLLSGGSGVLVRVRRGPRGDDEGVYSIPSPARSRRHVIIGHNRPVVPAPERGSGGRGRSAGPARGSPRPDRGPVPGRDGASGGMPEPDDDMGARRRPGPRRPGGPGPGGGRGGPFRRSPRSGGS